MENNTPTEDTNTPKTTQFYFKRLLSIFGVIILGALGSGLWESVISPFISWLSKKAFYFSKLISSNFTDSVYQSVSNGFYKSPSLQIDNFLSIVLIIVFAYLIKLYVNLQKPPKLKKRWAFIFWTSIFIGLTSSVFSILKTTFITETTAKTLSNIEIISPAIEEKEYRKLKSEFHSMTSEKDYLELQKKIIEIAEKNNLRLKK